MIHASEIDIMRIDANVPTKRPHTQSKVSKAIDTLTDQLKQGKIDELEFIRKAAHTNTDVESDLPPELSDISSEEEAENQIRTAPECPNCKLNDVQVASVQCGHLLCKPCSMKLTNKKCASCRRKVQAYIPIILP